MKKLLALFLSLLLMLPALALAQEQQVLNILSWEGYVDSDTIAAYNDMIRQGVRWRDEERA